MPNYDDLFTSLPAPQEEFNKDAWEIGRASCRERVWTYV